MNTTSVRTSLVQLHDGHDWLGEVRFSGRVNYLPDPNAKFEVQWCLDNHRRGLWGEVDDEEWRDNNAAIRQECGRVRSLWTLAGGEELEILTVADRSHTIVQLCPTDQPVAMRTSGYVISFEEGGE